MDLQTQDRELRKALCALCNWRVSPLAHHCEWGDYDACRGVYKHLSDPLEDLNAVHEAEKILLNTWLRRREYTWRLWDEIQDNPIADIGIVHTTARQRCRALLRVVETLP